MEPNPGPVRPRSLKTRTYMKREYLQAEAALAEVEMRGTLQKVAPPEKEDAKKNASTCRRTSKYADAMRGRRFAERHARSSFPVGENREPRTDSETPPYGPFFRKRGSLSRTPEEGDLPMLCRPGEIRTAPQKKECRLANHSNGDRGMLPFFGPVPWLWVYVSRTSPDLSWLFHVERVFFRCHNSDHLFFRLGRMHETWSGESPSRERRFHVREHQRRFQPTPKTHPFSIVTPPLAPTALPVASLRYRPHPERRQSRL